MGSDLEYIEVNRKTGMEPFHWNRQALKFDVLNFWQWFGSDLLNNTTRGILAEYLVARALGCASGVRLGWEPFDAMTPSGVRVEVKSAAYLQSWYQARLSPIGFDTRPTLGWDAKTNWWDSDRKRQAEVYVFCLLAHQEKATVDPLDMAQWRFFVLSAKQLDAQVGAQKRVGLARLLAIGAEETVYTELLNVVERWATEGVAM
jgi:hypothetical protein